MHTFPHPNPIEAYRSIGLNGVRHRIGVQNFPDYLRDHIPQMHAPLRRPMARHHQLPQPGLPGNANVEQAALPNLALPPRMDVEMYLAAQRAVERAHPGINDPQNVVAAQFAYQRRAMLPLPVVPQNPAPANGLAVPSLERVRQLEDEIIDMRRRLNRPLHDERIRELLNQGRAEVRWAGELAQELGLDHAAAGRAHADVAFAAARAQLDHHNPVQEPRQRFDALREANRARLANAEGQRIQLEQMRAQLQEAQQQEVELLEDYRRRREWALGMDMDKDNRWRAAGEGADPAAWKRK